MRARNAGDVKAVSAARRNDARSLALSPDTPAAQYDMRKGFVNLTVYRWRSFQRIVGQVVNGSRRFCYRGFIRRIQSHATDVSAARHRPRASGGIVGNSSSSSGTRVWAGRWELKSMLLRT